MAGTWKWSFGSDDFPDFNWVIFWFQPLIFQGVFDGIPLGLGSKKEQTLAYVTIPPPKASGKVQLWPKSVHDMF